MPEQCDDLQDRSIQASAQEQPFTATPTMCCWEQEHDSRFVDHVELVSGLHAVLVGSWEKPYSRASVCVKHKRIVFGHVPLAREVPTRGSSNFQPVDVMSQAAEVVDSR